MSGSDRYTFSVRYVQLHLAQHFVQDVCRQFQPCTRIQTNPTPGLTLTLTQTPSLTQTLWGARGRQGLSRGSAACFGGVFSKKRRATERPALANKTRIPHSVWCRMQLHTRRVYTFRCSTSKEACIPFAINSTHVFFWGGTH